MSAQNNGLGVRGPSTADKLPADSAVNAVSVGSFPRGNDLIRLVDEGQEGWVGSNKWCHLYSNIETKYSVRKERPPFLLLASLA